MGRLAHFFASILLVSFSTPERGEHDDLMDYIEKSIVLPNGALPLDKYARYYTEYRDSVIVGAYTTDIETREADFGCSEMLENFETKDVKCPALADAKLGERRWVAMVDYPAVAANDCHAIQLIFNKVTRKFVDVACVSPSH